MHWQQVELSYLIGKIVERIFHLMACLVECLTLISNIILSVVRLMIKISPTDLWLQVLDMFIACGTKAG